MVKISSCKKTDYIKVLQIEKSLFENPRSVKELKNYLNQKSFRIWTVKTKKIIGFVFFFHVKDEVEIIQIGIIKTYQRKKYGSILIDQIKKLKIKKIFLEVCVENSQAINFYLKNGFKKIGRRKAYYKGDKKRIDALRLLFEF